MDLWSGRGRCRRAIRSNACKRERSDSSLNSHETARPDSDPKAIDNALKNEEWTSATTLSFRRTLL